MKATEIKNKKLVVKITPNNMTYPKSGFQPGDFAIVKCRVEKVIEGELPDEIAVGEFSTPIMTVKGNFPAVSYSSQYILTGELVIDKTWGPQYNLVAMRLDYDLANEDDQRKFFSFFMTPNQVQSLFDTYQNPIDLLENKDMGKLCEVKGIGPTVAQRLCERYEACKDNSAAYIGLKELGLTKSAIDKLVKFYGSPDIVVSKINTNPYILATEVSGYGWLKTDAIAMRKGFTKDCRFRMEAFTKYYLEQQAEQNGNSWVKINDLLSAVETECYPITKENLTTWIKEMMMGPKEFTRYYNDLIAGKTANSVNKMPILFFDPESQNTGLLALRLLEKQISRHLSRLKNAPPKMRINEAVCASIIDQCEQSQGFKYTDEQKEGIWTILNNNVSILTGGAGCVDGEAEFLSEHGWKKIKDYKYGDKVLQWNEDGTTSFVLPEIYHKKPCESMYSFKTKYGINQKLTKDHTVITISPKGVLHKNSMQEIKDIQEQRGFAGRFITGFHYDKGTGVSYSDDELRLIIAAIADGSISRKAMAFNLKKDRKKERLEQILSKTSYQWTCHESSVKGYKRYYVYMPMIKSFPQEWYNQLSMHQLQLIAEELKYWDGSVKESTKNNVESIIISSNVKENADFIQFVYSSCGYRASICVKDRRNQRYKNDKYVRKSLEYTIIVSKNIYVGLCYDNRQNHVKTTICEEQTSDGYEYCFTVPSHAWIMRYNNCITVTGNCGKTSTLLAVTKILSHYNQSVRQCALSGRAASKLTEITNIEGKTIHRLLNYIPDKDNFMYSERNPLPADVVILDETSMVGGEIFLSLIQAIQSGSKFIMVGDQKQLEAIGLANILRDCMSSSYIPTTTLTKIHRQAAASGIITQSINISAGHAIVKNDFAGEEIRGELKDFKLLCSFKPEFVAYNIIKEYKRLFIEERIPADQIQVIVPMRVRGNISCAHLNEQIQEIVNPGVHPQQVIQKYKEGGVEYSVCYKPHDRIIVVKNNYCANLLNGGKTAIFNGNLGVIESIYNNSMVVNIDNVGKVVLSKDEWYNINLSYAITCHKCVTADTWVYTDKGLKQIKDLQNDYQNYLVYNGLYFEKPSGFVNAGKEEIINISTHYGYNIECTKDHHIFVYRNNEEIEINAEDVQKDDYLILPINFHSENEENQLTLLRELFEDSEIHLKNNQFDRIELSIKDFNFAKQVQLLLQQNGIIPSLHQQSLNNPFEKTNVSSVITISGESAQIFYQKIGFINPEKQEKLYHCLELNQMENCSSDTLKYSEDQTKAFIQVKDIVQKPAQDVYCLQMPTTHMFVQNGFLGGNCQGSQFPYCIVGLNTSCYALYSKEWLYTAVTRASKFCTVVAQPSALNQSVRISRVKTKQTWLTKDLINLMFQEEEAAGVGFN